MSYPYYPHTSTYGQMRLHPLVVAALGVPVVLFLLGLAALLAVAVMPALGLDAGQMQEPGLLLANLIPLQLVGFGLSAWLLVWGTGQPRTELGLGTASPVRAALAALTTLVLAPALAWAALDADSFTLPHGLEAFEQMAEAAESQATAQLSGFLTQPLWLLVVALAIVPAVCEELLFRGFLLGQLRRTFNVHAAIWLQGFLFSLIHLQVYGFFVRWLLGVLLGYLTLWCRSTVPAMTAHAANNALALMVGIWALQHDQPEVMAESYRPPWALSLACLLFGGALLFRLYRTRLPASSPYPQHE